MARAKSNSKELEAEIYRSAGETIMPPPEVGGLSEDELMMFNLVASSRAAVDWSDNDLVLLAEYCQITTHLQEARQTLRTEGDIVYNARGTPVSNPMFNVCDALLRQQLSLVRILGISGGHSGADKETLAKRADKQKEAAGKKASISLLAKPD